MISKKMVICLLFFVILSFLTETVYGNEPVPGAADVLQYALPAIAFGTTFAFDDSEGRYQFYKSAASCLAITQGLKRSINEERPAGHGNNSFPSGHTSSSFLGASFI